MRRSVLVASALMLLAAGSISRAQQPVLAPTSHPAISRDLSQLWLAPARGPAATRAASGPLASVVRLQADGDYSQALTVATQSATQQGALAQYAAYYAGVAQLRLGRAAEARQTFQSILEQKPVGYLSEAAALGEAEADEALNDFRAAVAIYERLLKGKTTAIEQITLRLGRAAKASGDLPKASEAFIRVYYEFALSEAAPMAGTELALLPNLETIAPRNQRYKLELGRAERLFGSRQYTPARTAFEALRPVASGDDRELVQLRLAECDYFQKRPRNARDALRPFTERASRQGEALYFYAVASREVGDEAAYLRTLQRIVAEFPTQSWAEEALNNLATYYILRDDDEDADATFRELYNRYPKGTYSDRAAWKAGWRAYRQGRFDETIGYFEHAAVDFPRSDYRPSWLYWAARAHEQLNERALAEQRYALVTADYQNSYYGRLTMKRLGASAPAARVVAVPADDGEDGAPTPQALPQNAAVVRALLGAELYDDALNELRFAQKVWGDTPAIEATIAWAHQQQARSESGMRRFQLLRGAINTMRRAYPQFMAAGGEDLPRDVLTVIYPLAYWDQIKKYSAANGLDPYLVAALMAQESTFVADIRSSANAYGLMQLLPVTARQYARKLGLRYSTRLLTDPETNIRLGTAYLADKMREFGDVHLVLASYNAGERAVHRWMAERQGLDREEFIDDIPYPETQTYVRKIVGTAEDYRRLYGGESRVDGLETTPKAKAVAEPAAPAVKNAVKKKAPAKKPSNRGRTGSHKNKRL